MQTATKFSYFTIILFVIGFRPAPTYRLPASHFRVHELGPASVVVPVTDDDRDVSVPCLANRLAVVHRLDNRHETLVLLYVPSNAGVGIQALCT